MLDETSIKVHKYIVLNSTERTFKGRISDIAANTGLTEAEVLRVLTTLEREKMIQVTFLDTSNIFKNIFEELLISEARYVEALEGLINVSPDSQKNDIIKLKELTMKYGKDLGYEKILSIDVTELKEAQKTVAQEMLSVLSFYVDPTTVNNPSSSDAIGLFSLYLDKLTTFVKNKDSLSDEEISLLSALLSLYVKVPKRKKVIVRKIAQNIYKSIESLQQSLEEVEVRILIEGASKELSTLRDQIIKQLEELRQMIQSLREEREMFFLTKNDLSDIIKNLAMKRIIFEKIVELQIENNPYYDNLRLVASRYVQLMQKMEGLIRTLLSLLPDEVTVS